MQILMVLKGVSMGVIGCPKSRVQGGLGIGSSAGGFKV